MRRIVATACLLTSLGIGCSPMSQTPPAARPDAEAAAIPAGLRYEALIDPLAHTVTITPVGFRTAATGLFVRSANAIWNGGTTTFSFDTLVTNNTGASLSTVRGVVLSTTPGSPTVTATGTNGTLGAGQPYYDYGTIANGGTGTANWKFSIPSATPFRFGFTIQQGAGIDAGPIKNHDPVVNSVTPTSPSIATGASTTITASTGDPDSDGLTYAWSAPSGGTITGSGATITYTAPGSSGTYPVNLTVNDGKGASATGSTSISVTSGGGTGTAQGNLSFGNTPASAVKRVTLSPASVTINPGDPLTLTATGLDNPGNAVATTWTWSQSGTAANGNPWLGIFDQGTTGSIANWRTFDGRTDSGSVTVTARSANNQTASMTINVRELAPVIKSNTPAATCTVSHGVPLDFIVVFHDANGNDTAAPSVGISPNTNYASASISATSPDLNGDRTITLHFGQFTAAGSKTLSIGVNDGTSTTTMSWNVTIL